MQSQTPTVFVSVGTDHLPFTRLVQWVEAWDTRGVGVRFRVQHGYTRAPRGAETDVMLDHETLTDVLAQSDVVVCQAGPGSIMDARATGHIPIVVPRLPELGECVDGHQVLFAHRLADAGAVRIAETEESFRTLIEAAVSEPVSFRADPRSEDLSETVSRLNALVEELMRAPKVPRCDLIFRLLGR